MRSGTLWIALWLGMIIGGVPSPVAAQLSPAAAKAQQSAASQRRAAMLQQSVLGQPPAQSAAQTADMSIIAIGSSKGMPAVGDLVTYTLVIANAGPSQGNRGRVTLTLDTANISVESVRGVCDALPCYVPTAAPGSSQSVLVDLRILAEGGFGFTARVRALQPDPDETNNAAVVSMSPPPPTPTPTPTTTPTPESSATPLPMTTPTECLNCQPPPPWWLDWINPWTLGCALLVGLALIGVAILKGLRYQARQRWLRRLQVTADVEAMACEAGPLPLLAPGLTLSVRCEPGEAGAAGAVPINKVVYDD